MLHGSYWSILLPLMGVVTSTHWTRNFVGPKASTETFEKEKQSLFLLRFEPQFHSEPAHVLVTVTEMNHNYSQLAHVLVTVPSSHMVNNNNRFLSSVCHSQFWLTKKNHTQNIMNIGKESTVNVQTPRQYFSLV